MRVRKTSATDPIRVDWLESPLLPRTSVGITFAPGKKDPHGQSAIWDRDLREDLRVLREEHKADTLICLLKDAELDQFQIPDLAVEAQHAGLRFLRLPVQDGTAPPDSGALRDTVALAVREAQAGRRVVVRCRGGLGRAGTFAAYCLVAVGVPPAEAIASVRSVRHRAIENSEQERSIHRFAPS